MKKLTQRELDVLPIGTKLWIEFQYGEQKGRKTEAIIEQEQNECERKIVIITFSLTLLFSDLQI